MHFKNKKHLTFKNSFKKRYIFYFLFFKKIKLFLKKLDFIFIHKEAHYFYFSKNKNVDFIFSKNRYISQK